MKKTNRRVIDHRRLRALAPVDLSWVQGSGIGTTPTLTNAVPCVGIRSVIPCVGSAVPCVSRKGVQPCVA